MASAGSEFFGSLSDGCYVQLQLPSGELSCNLTTDDCYPGMRDGQQIRFSGEGDQEPGLEPGDIVIVLDEKEHNVFRRHGHDLSMTMEITLAESLCGFQRTIQTLDNRTLVISCIPGTWRDLLFYVQR